MDDQSCSTREAAEALGICVRTAQLWVEQGRLRAWKTPGGHRRILRESVNAELRAREKECGGGASIFDILIVEDEKDWVTLMTRALENEIEERGLSGQIVIDTARNATDARRLMALNAYQLMSLDMRLPEGPTDSAIEVKHGEYLAQELSIASLLPKTIIYSLNPADDAQIGTILGCFQNSEVPGKIQHGSAWWFNDHKIGMEEQMTRLASLGLLGNFVGMLTDSRSFLSYTRHDYFRRILCNIIGQWVEDGEYPNDEKALEKIVKGICFDNAKRYFNL